jgi:hypothetical protein
MKLVGLVGGALSLLLGLEPGVYYQCKVTNLLVEGKNGKIDRVKLSPKIENELGPWEQVKIGIFAKPIEGGVIQEFVVKVANRTFEYAPVGRGGNLLFYASRNGGVLVYDISRPDEVGLKLFSDTLAIYKCSRKEEKKANSNYPSQKLGSR